MSVGSIPSRILTDIGNAIRYQAGVATTYTPGQLATAVAALDGSNAGNYSPQSYKTPSAGFVADDVFSDIADAIRGQNGSSDTYTPEDMAQAILDLTWGSPALRAVYTTNGDLEFNYLPTVQSVHGGTVSDSFEVDYSGYSDASSLPWASLATSIKRVYFDSSLAAFISANYVISKYWCSGFTNLIEAYGFENILSSRDICYIFKGDTRLRSVFCSISSPSYRGSSTQCFNECYSLVGGSFNAYTWSRGQNFSDGRSLLTNPNNDSRVWVFAHAYSNGSLVFTTSEQPAPFMTDVCPVTAICSQADYDGIRHLLYRNLTNLSWATFDSSMDSVGVCHIYYWFYGLTTITSINNLNYLHITNHLNYAFIDTGVTTLDFRGFDFSHVSQFYSLFQGCSNLTTIYVDSDFALTQAQLSANNGYPFSGCTSLRGGNGTTYDNNHMDIDYMRIDTAATPGYLTTAI